MSRYQSRPEGWVDTGFAAVTGGGTIWSGNPIVERGFMHGAGTIVAARPGNPDKAMCLGCADNHYNQPGNSIDGECWSFKLAKVCDKVGHSTLNVQNGMDTVMRDTLSCWHAVSR